MNTENNRTIIKRSGLVTRQDSDIAAANLPKINSTSTATGKPFLVPLALIHESPYQSYPINQQKVAELVENLKNNPLSSPIVLRRRNDGELEIIAGRHRLEAYKLLNRTEIESTLRNLDDDQAERLVFFDNLLGPDLTDFQKYLGFAQRKRSKKLTQEQLAAEAGVHQGTVSRLMSFDGLSDFVLQELTAHPASIGTKYAAEFVQLSKLNDDIAIQAIRLIAEGKMTQKSALEWMKAGGKQKSSPEKETIDSVIKSGRHNYAKMALRSNRITITFSDEDKAINAWDQVEKLLQASAKPPH